MRYTRWLGALAIAGLSAAANAVPVLQLYVEGATYDTTHESWVFEAGSDPFRVWVIGNVDGPGGKGDIIDVKLTFTYANEGPGQDLSLNITPSQAGGLGVGTFDGFDDPSVATAATFVQYNDNGDLPMLGDGSTIAPHGVFGDGWEWQEFGIGDMTLTDSQIADFISTFPDAPSETSGQINAYDVTVDFPLDRESLELHIDAYDHVQSGNRSRYVFAPFSHDAGTGINHPVPAPAPLLLLGVGLLGLGLRLHRR